MVSEFFSKCSIDHEVLTALAYVVRFKQVPSILEQEARPVSSLERNRDLSLDIRVTCRSKARRTLCELSHAIVILMYGIKLNDKSTTFIEL